MVVPTTPIAVIHIDMINLSIRKVHILKEKE